MNNNVTCDIKRTDNQPGQEPAQQPDAARPRRGRPRLYASAAEKQRAYRREAGKSVRVDRAAYESLVDAIAHLREAVEEAAKRGHPLARACAGKKREVLIRTLAAAIEQDNLAH